MTFFIILAFIIALIADSLSTEWNEKAKNAIGLVGRVGLFVLTGLMLILIYLIDLWHGEYFWLAFIIGFVLLIIIDLDKKPIKKAVHVIGYFVITGIMLYLILYTRYELQTKFYQPCWSPDGKQIAFFMEKALYRYTPSMFSFSSPDDIWKKYYLCTMDYDGGSFKQIKKMEQVTNNISWSGNSDIVYITDITEFDQIMGINLTNNEITEIYRATDKTRLIDPWLSKDGKYIGILNENSSEDLILIVIDANSKKIVINIKDKYKLFSEYRKSYFGSFIDNKVAYYLANKVIVCDLDSKKEEEFDIKDENHTLGELSGYDYGPISPDRSMKAMVGSAIGVAGVGVVSNIDEREKISEVLERTKRSYLFNIFSN